MRTRPGKVNVVVIGEGLAALLTALRLAEAGRRVALLAESDWNIPPGPAEWLVVPLAGGAASRARYAAAGFSELAELGQRFPDTVAETEAIWLGDVPGGATEFVRGDANMSSALGRSDGSGTRVPAMRVHVERLHEAVADAAQAAGAEILHTRVRGVSVIEGQILGAVSEAARFDARHDIFASEDPQRAHALSKMALEPIRVQHRTLPLRRLQSISDTPVCSTGGMLWPAEESNWLLGDLPIDSLPTGAHVADVSIADADTAPYIGPSDTVTGAWHLLGTCGRLLEAIGAAQVLTNTLLSSE